MSAVDSRAATRDAALACPFCGDKPRVEQSVYPSTGYRCWVILCSTGKCHLNPIAVGRTLDIALERWNTRAP